MTGMAIALGILVFLVFLFRKELASLAAAAIGIPIAIILVEVVVRMMH